MSDSDYNLEIIKIEIEYIKALTEALKVALDCKEIEPLISTIKTSLEVAIGNLSEKMYP